MNDFYRVSSVPSIVGLSEVTFKSQLHRALARDEVRANLKSQTKTTAEAASPGPLKNEREWKQWEEKFNNYCASHLGAFGIPLSYVIRDDDAPATNYDDYPEFIHRTVACAPLTGEYYNADKLTVFNMVVSFTTGQPSGDWVKDTLKYHDGRRSMKVLRSHFSGDGMQHETSQLQIGYMIRCIIKLSAPWLLKPFRHNIRKCSVPLKQRDPK